MRRSWVLVLGLLGCNYDATGQGSGSGTGTGTAGGDTTAASTSGSATTAASVETGGSGSTTRVDSSGTGTTSTDPDSSSSGEPLPTARSCREILYEDDTATTGPHSIVRERDGAVIEVWCEMDLDGGGWTLVARSLQSSDVGFGWGVAHGAVGDETQPYSLDVMDLGMAFAEVLVGRRSGFATVVEHAYVIEVPAGFVEDYRDAPYQSSGARTVLGGCNPNGGPAMLRWLGYTDDTERYFFRDFSGDHPYGLFSNEMRVFYDDCNNGGQLNDEQGVLFVR